MGIAATGDSVMDGKELKRRQRAYRILDAAARLLLKWGYNKTTIDDVAREAGVAKGTIYLHWKTREDLFRALIQREGIEMGAAFRRRTEDDPDGVTLRGIYRNAALGLLERPLLKAVIVNDATVLGRLAQAAHPTQSYAEKLAGFNVYLSFLRDHDLIRKDLDLKQQIQVVTGVLLGLLVAAPMMPGELTLTDAQTADLIGEAIHRTLETDRKVPRAEMKVITRAFLDYFDRIMATANRLFEVELGLTHIGMEERYDRSNIGKAVDQNVRPDTRVGRARPDRQRR